MVGYTEEGRKAETPEMGRGQKDAQRPREEAEQEEEEEVKLDVVVQKATKNLLF